MEFISFFLKPGKINILRIMMITAQVMLMSFATHWLVMQYREQEQLLENNILGIWEGSQQQMIDTFLVKEYIEPVMDSSDQFNLHFEFTSDSVHTLTQSTQGAIISSCLPPVDQPSQKNSKIVIHISDSLSANQVYTNNSPSIVSRDLVLKGVKLFVNKHTNSKSQSRNISSIWTAEPDTALFKRTFTSKLNALIAPASIHWKTVKSNDSIKEIQLMHYNLQLGDKKIEAGIENYRYFILKSISTQLFFALVLVLLTMAAFIISFRSLKYQVRLNSQRNDFIRNMSHELKTPVATVKVALEALRNFNRRNEPVIMEDYLEMANSETNRLELLINRVMSISDNGEALLPNISKVELNTFLSEVTDSLKARIEAENAILTLKLSGESITIMMDRLYIQGVLINLVDNSLKYSMQPAEIEIEPIKEHDSVRIMVSDRGIGVAPEYRTKVFEKFFRVPTGDLHNIKGYGLGLCYAETVMKQHGGSIHYHPRQGGGSCFELQFPI